MKTFHLALLPLRRAPLAFGLALSLIGFGSVRLASAGPDLEWDTELHSMDLGGTALMPLGPGWSPIATAVRVRESPTLASLGKAYARFGGPPAAGGGGGGGVQTGDPYFVQSFFDVFFDITVTDVDPQVNFGGGPVDGLSLTFANNGPAHMENAYQARADANAPNFGLIPPPESAPYIGHFNIEIPLGADLNGNGELDKLKFTLVSHTVADQNRTFITLPDGTVIDNFDSLADLSGAVVDLSQDPPFSIGLTGPTTASSRLLPEPSSLALLASLGSVALAIRRRRLPNRRR